MWAGSSKVAELREAASVSCRNRATTRAATAAKTTGARGPEFMSAPLAPTLLRRTAALSGGLAAAARHAGAVRGLPDRVRRGSEQPPCPLLCPNQSYLTESRRTLTLRLSPVSPAKEPVECRW